MCYNKKFFQAGDGRLSFVYVKIPIGRQLLCFLKVKATKGNTAQTARSISPFYLMKIPFWLPWLQNRLQTISFKIFPMFKNNVLDEISLLSPKEQVKNKK